MATSSRVTGVVRADVTIIAWCLVQKRLGLALPRCRLTDIGHAGGVVGWTLNGILLLAFEALAKVRTNTEVVGIRDLSHAVKLSLAETGVSATGAESGITGAHRGADVSIVAVRTILHNCGRASPCPVTCIVCALIAIVAHKRLAIA